MSHPNHDRATPAGAPTTTAGLRTAGLRGAHWDAARLPPEAGLSVHPVQALDGGITTGFLFGRGGEGTVVCIMHPRELLVSHYLVPDILAAGCAAWVQAPRAVGNDLRLEHEIALLDVGAAMRELRKLGYGQVVLLGNSGGAALYALYNDQALKAPEGRIRQTPGGRPTRLEKDVLPVADGIVFVSPHPGPGRLLMNALDPSVVDENDPFSVDAGLDPFSAANGFDLGQGRATYSEAFLDRYRAGQRARVERLDEHARDLISLRRRAKSEAAEDAQNRHALMWAGYAPIFTVWRTDADPRCWDPSLDPSERRPGSLWGRDPFVSNWGSVGFARLCSPESWLSTWSGLSSNASVTACAEAIEQPALLIDYSGDPCVFPSDAAEIHAAIRSPDKRRVTISGDHHGRPLQAGGDNGQLAAGRLLQAWLREHFS